MHPIVTTPDSFFYHLQTRKEVRDELASRGVYTRQDMPNFSLRRLDQPDLTKLGVPANAVDPTKDVISLLGPNAGNIVAGFKDALYQDYITGQNQFVLAFSGTNDNIWANEWDDWINNVNQGLGRYAPQYAAAMEIGYRLANFTPGIPNGHVSATGHSLGGGLASAAAVASGMFAETFNAAGLNVATLNDALYPNSTNRYQNETNPNAQIHHIAAFHVDWDILTFIQDLTFLPDAIGVRMPELDGPFDGDIFWSTALAAANFADGNLWGVASAGASGITSMIKAHKNESVLYGLLVQETTTGIGFVWDVLGYDAYKHNY